MKLPFPFLIALLLIPAFVLSSDVPVVSIDTMNIGLRLQRDTVILQARSVELVREYERIQSELKAKSSALESLFKSLEKPGFKLDPETWVYTALESKPKSD